MLADRFGELDLHRIILPHGEIHPFPRAAERAGWGGVTPETASAWLSAAEGYRGFAWPALTADHYLRFRRTGENLPYLMVFWERRAALGVLALAECLEGEGRYLDQIINGIYCICEETTWMTPFDLSNRGGILPSQTDKIVDLSCSETAALLAWVDYLLGAELDAVSPVARERIRQEVHERLVVPYLERDDYWWMGFVETPRVNNWNPWCNRNMLTCFLLLEREQETRVAGIRKAMRSLDVYLRRYPPDGCCDEGPMYWGAAGGGLHTCLALLRMASSGAIDVFTEPIVREIGRYISRVHIHGDYFVDFADGDAVVGINPVIYEYGRDIGDEAMTRLGAAAPPARPKTTIWFGMYEYLVGILNEPERRKAAGGMPYERDAWMWHTQVMVAREKGGSERGFFLAAKGGTNGESHNHNDIGNFIVYVDGSPLLIDLGTEEYTAKTFSPQRFELWYLQSQYHNCPTIRGVQQEAGERYAAREVACRVSESEAALEMDIAAAYPAAAGVDSWIRTVRLLRGSDAAVEVVDDYRLSQEGGPVSRSLMTPCPPRLSPGRIGLEYAPGKTVTLFYDGKGTEAKSEEIALVESRLRRNWGEQMYRIVLTEREARTAATLRLRMARAR
jgi:hypothetical protein